MILRDILRLTATAALLVCAAPSVAQTIPHPQPRPASLTPPPATAAPAAEAPTPAVAMPAPTPVATTTPAESPAAAPAVAEPLPADQTAAAPADPAAAADPNAPVSGLPEPAPLDLTQPQTFETPPSAISPGAAVAVSNPVDTPAEQQTLTKVNSYFNGIRTLVGNFTQVGPDGSKADGKFFLMKPGRVRFYYQRPSTTDIIADGKSLVVRDRKLATQDVYPLGQTPLRFLLDTNLDLARDSKVVGVYEEPGLVSVAIEEETTFGGKARVLIVFASEDNVTYELKQWTITDAQGLDTTVAVSELDSATKPAEKLFEVDYTRDIKRN